MTDNNKPNDDNDKRNGQQQQNPMGKRQNERMHDPYQQDYKPNEPNTHFLERLANRFIGWIKNIYNRVYNGIESMYDSKHFPFILGVLITILTALIGILGLINLNNIPKWVKFGWLAGTSISMFLFYATYYHILYYKISNAKMEAVKVMDYVANEITILFTGEDNLYNDDNVFIKGAKKLATMDASGDAIKNFKLARQIVYGTDEDNDLNEDETALIATPEEMHKIEGGLDKDSTMRNKIIQNNQMLLNQTSKDKTDVLQDLKKGEKLYEQVIQQVVNDLQNSNLMDSDLSMGEIFNAIDDEHFMSQDTDSLLTKDPEEMTEQERKQIYAMMQMTQD